VGEGLITNESITSTFEIRWLVEQWSYIDRPITKTDWEKIEVQPDSTVSVAQALQIVVERINHK